MNYRLLPVAEPFEKEVAEIFEGYPKRDGYILQLFRVFANSVRFLKKGTVNLLDRGSPISMREREIIILRTCANNHCEYEWGVHVAGFADHVGLTTAQVEATCAAVIDGTLWTEKEQTLMCVVDRLCAVGSVPDDLLEAFQSKWTLEEQLEILALVGNYHTISFVANTARLARESFAAGFPRGVATQS